MRILQVVHDFLPNHLAGVEVYTDAVSRRMATDHQVAILYSEVVPEAPNYSLRRGRHGHVETFELVNNHLYQQFEETYSNREIDRRLTEVLDEFRPDVIHIQHLLNLSVNLVYAARRRAIPTVMTLHDHWLACANGGQRFHRELGRCDVLDAGRCGACTATMATFAAETNGVASRWSKFDQLVNRYSLADRDPDEIETPEPAYVYKDQYLFEEEWRPSWVAHPRSRLVFRLNAREEKIFSVAIGMHPNTFDQKGGGVRFTVCVNGVERFSHALDPKRRPEDRVPFPILVPIDKGRVELELKTEAVPADGGIFCTAGWIDPSIVTPERALHRIARSSVKLAGWPQRLANRRRVGRRWRAIRKMASQVDLFISPSRYLRDEFIRFGFDREKVLLSDYGFKVDGFQRRIDLPEFARHFAFVGSVVKHKGLHILLDAFRRMPADATLRICGALDYDPIYAAELQAQQNHPGVQFLGAVPNAKIAAFLAETDCLVVPSIWTENSPLTIHEAFLAGIPVVVSRLGGHQDLVAEGGGFLYEADDAEDLAKQLLRLSRKRGLLRETAAGIPSVKPMDSHVDELLGIYRQVLSGATRLVGSPDRGSPDRVSPDRVSPDRVSPDRVSPDRVSPDRGLLAEEDHQSLG